MLERREESFEQQTPLSPMQFFLWRKRGDKKPYSPNISKTVHTLEFVTEKGNLSELYVSEWCIHEAANPIFYRIPISDATVVLYPGCALSHGHVYLLKAPQALLTIRICLSTGFPYFVCFPSPKCKQYARSQGLCSVLPLTLAPSTVPRI